MVVSIKLCHCIELFLHTYSRLMERCSLVCWHVRAGGKAVRVPAISISFSSSSGRRYRWDRFTKPSYRTAIARTSVVGRIGADYRRRQRSRWSLRQMRCLPSLTLCMQFPAFCCAQNVLSIAVAAVAAAADDDLAGWDAIESLEWSFNSDLRQF